MFFDYFQVVQRTAVGGVRMKSGSGAANSEKKRRYSLEYFEKVRWANERQPPFSPFAIPGLKYYPFGVKSA